jgi:hypothetical protein
MGIKMKNVFNQEIKKSIDMRVYGITVVVLTTQKEIDEILREFTCNPRNISDWQSEKVGLLNYLKFVLTHEDKYFNAAMEVSHFDEKRWADFMSDCVVYSCLHSHLNGLDVPAKDSYGLEDELNRFIDKLEGQEKEEYSLYKKTGTNC